MGPADAATGRSARSSCGSGSSSVPWSRRPRLRSTVVVRGVISASRPATSASVGGVSSPMRGRASGVGIRGRPQIGQEDVVDEHYVPRWPLRPERGNEHNQALVIETGVDVQHLEVGVNQNFVPGQLFSPESFMKPGDQYHDIMSYANRAPGPQENAISAQITKIQATRWVSPFRYLHWRSQFLDRGK